MANELCLLGAGKAGASFSPLDISGLKLWLSADSLAASLSDGDPVGTWADLSGNGNDATQATAAKKPTYQANVVGGRGVVRFDGVDDRMQTGNFASFAGKRGTFLVVAKRAFISASRHTLVSSYNGPSAPRWQLIRDIAKLRYYDESFGNWRELSVLPASQASYDLYTLVRDSDDGLHAYYNSVESSSAINNDQPAVNPLGIGSMTDLDAEALDGDIAAVLYYDSALTTAQRQAVEAYLNSYYGGLY